MRDGRGLNTALSEPGFQISDTSQQGKGFNGQGHRRATGAQIFPLLCGGERGPPGSGASSASRSLSRVKKEQQAPVSCDPRSNNDSAPEHPPSAPCPVLLGPAPAAGQRLRPERGRKPTSLSERRHSRPAPSTPPPPPSWPRRYRARTRFPEGQEANGHNGKC
ncbi:hypothetical protein SKAU_G00341000 [Synaphobranchus kaupii]|uniref:Uncharacterized protein n=1 Tax=Synaphobranchus kaupii TaxID=118154 RepID=A0A9Q1EMZ5_SYNKA|nr:hypothetical protein SKAU_G00341000 [Synaphobranchus kaupii]